MLKSFLDVFFTAIVKLSCSYELSTHELFHHFYRISKVNYLFFNLIHFNIFFLSHHFLYYFFYLIFFLYSFFYLIFFYIFFVSHFFFYILFSISYFSILFFLSHFFYLIFFYIFFSQKVYREMKDIESLDSSLSPIVETTKEKFLKCWEELPAVTIIVNCLHPSFKKKIHCKVSSKVQIKATSTH
jgi:hypothetical protein